MTQFLNKISLLPAQTILLVRCPVTGSYHTGQIASPAPKLSRHIKNHQWVNVRVILITKRFKKSGTDELKLSDISQTTVAKKLKHRPSTCKTRTLITCRHSAFFTCGIKCLGVGYVEPGP